jgi:hypothetical protein
MPGKYFYTAMLLSSFLSVQCSKQYFSFKSPEIYYEGRVKSDKDVAELSWSGTSVSVRFEGTGISAILKDSDTASYFNVIIDGNLVDKIHTDTEKRSYVLASGLPAGNHNVQLFKRTEWELGITSFFGFEAPEGTKLLPAPEAKKRKIEFYGNSITCGYALEDSSGNDSWHGYFENNYLTYAAITARHFDAQYACIAKSGIGIMLSWFPLIMPEMYGRLDPADSTSDWDFNKYTPDVVVINLFQNDSWLVKNTEHEQFKYRFGTHEPDENFIIASYKNFVSAIRKKYPDARIICSLGNMDATKEGSPWPGYILQATGQLNDPKIFTHFFKYKNTDGHPSIAQQKAMATSLIQFIENNISW